MFGFIFIAGVFAILALVMAIVVAGFARQWFESRDIANGVRAMAIVLSADTGTWAVRQGPRIILSDDDAGRDS